MATQLGVSVDMQSPTSYVLSTGSITLSTVITAKAVGAGGLVGI